MGFHPSAENHGMEAEFAYDKSHMHSQVFLFICQPIKAPFFFFFLVCSFLHPPPRHQCPLTAKESFCSMTLQNKFSASVVASAWILTPLLLEYSEGRRLLRTWGQPGLLSEFWVSLSYIAWDTVFNKNPEENIYSFQASPSQAFVLVAEKKCPLKGHGVYFKIRDAKLTREVLSPEQSHSPKENQVILGNGTLMIQRVGFKELKMYIYIYTHTYMCVCV